MKSLLTVVILITVTLAHSKSPGQPTPQDTEAAPPATYSCSQPASEQDEIIREAERDQYVTRRVEFLGNAHTRDYTLRRKVAIGLQEGELFTRWNVIRSLRNVSKLKKIIYPVSIKDVVLRIDRTNKLIDVNICFREKRGSKRAK